MKLFQRLLVAPAALGLMAPLAANADVSAISKDSDLNSEVIEARVEGVEAQLGDVMAGQFSSSTKMSGESAFITGWVDSDSDATNSDSMTMEYSYSLSLSTSFTGEDNLFAKIEAGNVGTATGTTDHFGNALQGTYLSATADGGDGLQVDKLWYQFQIGDTFTAWIGPKIENSDMLSSAPSVYNSVTKQFAKGGNGSAYGSSNAPGFGVAWTQDVADPSDGRWAISANYTSLDGGLSTENEGLFGDNASDSLLTKVEYGSPRWQVSLATTFKDNPGTGKYDSMFHTAAAEAATGDTMTAIGLRAYWKPESTGAIPSVQLGLDRANFEGEGTDAVGETTGWMVGFGWTDVLMDGNKAGIAYGSRQHGSDYNGVGDDLADDNRVWEAYYSFKLNDGVTITPAIFGGSEVIANDEDVNGGVLLTEFRF